MIPPFNDTGVLPPGLERKGGKKRGRSSFAGHDASIKFEAFFDFNKSRPEARRGGSSTWGRL
jgi:hypothetical protein